MLPDTIYYDFAWAGIFFAIFSFCIALCREGGIAGILISILPAIVMFSTGMYFLLSGIIRGIHAI